MNSIDTIPLEKKLRPQLVEYAVGSYSLLNDLKHLEGVRQAGAAEATIFYCGRILEVLAASAVQTIGMTPSASAFSNLEALAQFNLIATTTQYWANALRRLGNEVRHVLRPTSARDADLAALFAERWLDWYFCRFRFGPRLSSITLDSSALLPSSDPALPPLLRAMDDENFDPSAWLPGRWPGAHPPYMAASTVAAVVANLLIDHGEIDAAFEVLGPARAQFPDDLRLVQLAVFAWKRRGDLEKAVETAGPLLARSRDDDETAGIVAGVYKQLYLDRGRELDILNKSLRAYMGGWESSKNSNAYLGINAAACALWLGRPGDSRRLAGEVRQVLLKRIETMNARQGVTHLEISFWDQVTLAEAELLLGEFAAARARYRRAFDQTRAKGNIKVAADQAQRHLASLGLSLPWPDFVAAADASTKAEIAIGLTGHRSLDHIDSVRARLLEIIEQVKLESGGESARVILLSGLAAGADILAAEVVLDEGLGAVWGVMPLEMADYRRDFGPVDLPRFQALINRVERLVLPPAAVKTQRGKGVLASDANEERNAGYEWSGRYIVDRCQVLIAVWDGQPSRGRGGTAEVVAYAKEMGRPVAWLSSIPPFELTRQ